MENSLDIEVAAQLGVMPEPDAPAVQGSELPNTPLPHATSQGHNPASRSTNSWWKIALGGVLIIFFLKMGVSLKPPEPLDGTVFCKQNCLKIHSNLKWETTKGMYMFCLQDSYICFLKMEFYSFFFANPSRSGFSNGEWKCKYRKVLTMLYIIS